MYVTFLVSYAHQGCIYLVENRVKTVITEHEPIISSSLLVIVRNKHEWSSEGILFYPWKDINAHHFQVQVHRH